MNGIGFSTALSALSTAQSALSIIGNNIANAATPGYTRQRVSLNSLPAGMTTRRFQIGRGVEISGVDRVTDALLVDRLRAQQSEVGRYGVLSDHFYQLETLFSEPGPNGLSALMGGFFGDVSGLTSAPEDPALRTQLLQSADTMTSAFNTLSNQLFGMGRGISAAIQTEVAIINGLAAELGSLNDSIAVAGMGPSVPPDLLDRQDQLLQELAQHVDIRAVHEADGRVTVFSAGNVLVTPRGSNELTAYDIDPVTGQMGVRLDGATTDLAPRGGRLKALLEISEEGLDSRMDGLNQLAHSLILESNRVHSTGVPLGGGYKTLASRNFFVDANGNGSSLDDPIDQTNLPFDVAAGTLMVNVSDMDTGVVTQTRIDIDPTMTVQNLVDDLGAVPGLTASVDPLGQLRISALGNRRFEFSNRVQPSPDLNDTFGSSQATIVGTLEGPFALSAGQSFSMDIDGAGPQTVTFDPSQFVDISQATPQEVADAINAQVTGATAEVADGRVVIRSNSTGTASTVQLNDGTGSPLATLGLSTALETGSDVGVVVSMEGAYTGNQDLDLVFVPNMAGRIGADAGLQIEVFDQSGALVTTLDVGSGYEPGKPLEVADGVMISFGAGEIDPGSGDRFTTRLVADSDTSDILVAAGLGGLFVGSDATSIGIDPAILDDPDRLAAALGGSAGDNSNLLLLQTVQHRESDGLGDRSPDEFYDMLITELGADSLRADQTFGTQNLVLDSLEARREQISGVNLDEELLALEHFQQLYGVAARFLQTMQEVNDILINI